jgi:hypothetical protein
MGTSFSVPTRPAVQRRSRAIRCPARKGGRWLIAMRQVNLIDCNQNLRNPSIVI